MPDITRIYRDTLDPTFIYINVTQPDWYTVLPGGWAEHVCTFTGLASPPVSLRPQKPPACWHTLLHIARVCEAPLRPALLAACPSCPHADITAFDVLVRSIPTSPNPLWSTAVIAPDFTVISSAWPAAQVSARRLGAVTGGKRAGAVMWWCACARRKPYGR